MTDKVDHSSNISRRALLNRGLASAAIMAVPSALVPVSGASKRWPACSDAQAQRDEAAERPSTEHGSACPSADTAVTEADRLFVCNNGLMPVNPNSASWGVVD